MRPSWEFHLLKVVQKSLLVTSGNCCGFQNPVTAPKSLKNANNNHQLQNFIFSPHLSFLLFYAIDLSPHLKLCAKKRAVAYNWFVAIIFILSTA